jgi:hypothetical protein
MRKRKREIERKEKEKEKWLTNRIQYRKKMPTDGKKRRKQKTRKRG